MSEQLTDRADMYDDVRGWLDRNIGPGWRLSDDTVAHLADWLVVERGWSRHG